TGIVGIHISMGFMPLKIRWQRGTTAHQEQGQNGNDKSKFVPACHGLFSYSCFYPVMMSYNDSPCSTARTQELHRLIVTPGLSCALFSPYDCAGEGKHDPHENTERWIYCRQKARYNRDGQHPDDDTFYVPIHVPQGIRL
ncbi:MAG: hypothetical protein KAI84_06960, partial [Gammaproteobacteria bacterium]|nr:hypothetical protein [Gammaproteobacteria bacterium]